MSHRFHFFRAGAVDQVSLRDGDDVLALPELDQKLWVALAMPTRDVGLDPATLDLLDPDHDGRIRVPDMLSAVASIKATFKQPGDVLKSKDEVALDAIADAKVAATARRMLTDLGRASVGAISIADVGAIAKAFADTKLNGDGVVTPASTDDAELAHVITDIVACHAGALDRSGKQGSDRSLAAVFFAEADAHVAWLDRPGADASLRPLGDATGAAADALVAIAAKLEDFFARCRVVAYDARAAAAMAGQDADYLALGAKALTTGADDIARLPLARVDAAGRLPLTGGLNPAWAARLSAFVEAAVKPLLGARDALTAADVDAVTAKLAGFVAWRAAKPASKLDGLDAAWLRTLAAPGVRARLEALIAADAALEAEYAAIESVEKLVRFQRDFGRILRNFVNFSDFYSRQDGAFQCGTLYLDGRAAHLCVPVTDAAKHGALAASSAAYLAYCELTRGAAKRQIAAAITNGDADNLFVGRNGVFYDRDGKDWDATITKIVSNPISIREAFWTPYKKAVRLIEDQVTKRAAAADAAANTKMESAAAKVATADQAALPPAAPPAPPEAKKIDVGTVAAIGVAIGGIGALIVGLMSSFLGLGKWLPLGVLALLLLISGPSMLLAWLKLRQRNLGPILDANGWAINGRARVNVAFGAAMTELAKLPPGAQRSVDDPFADKRRPWKLYFTLILVLVLGGAWYVGSVDKYLPNAARSTTVLGKHAPAYKAPAAAATPTPTPTPSPTPTPTP